MRGVGVVVQRWTAVRRAAVPHVARARRHLPHAVAALVVFGLPALSVPVAAAGRPVADPALVRAVSDATGPGAVFVGSDEPGRAGVESSARAMVTASGGLPVGPETLGPWVRSGGALVGTDRCPPADLAVSWRPPEGDPEVGAYVEPLGPPPTDATTRVNGIVVCRTSTFAFTGFEAAWDGVRWRLAIVPALADETDEPLLEGEAEATGATPVSSTEGGSVLPPTTAWAGAPLEPLAPYVPQLTCDPTAKPGVLGFRDLLLGAFPGSRNLGIGRVCEAEGVSEHKEGRAFDWGVAADDPAERAAAEAVLAWMLGPDDAGEPHAIARRLGLMYVIWDQQIWSAFRAADGWRPYVGVSGHRDHIHFSFDWPGSLGETSFWRGGAARLVGSTVPDLPLVPVAPRPLAPPPGAAGALPPFPLPPGLMAPAASTSESRAESPPPESTTTSTTSTTTTTTTTTTSPPPSTTTTAAPIVTFPSSPPTSVGFTSL